MNNGKSPTLVVPASVTGNIRDVLTNLGTKTVVFTTSAFGAYSVASSGEQQFVWAYIGRMHTRCSYFYMYAAVLCLLWV